MTRQQEQMILRLWSDWCRLWPEQYGHNSLQVKEQGYDPVFDVIPSQVYKDFYFEVVRGHPMLKHINAFEIVDTALNQIRAPETPVIEDTIEIEDSVVAAAQARAPARAGDHPRVVEVELPDPDGKDPKDEADTA